jgi:hypothetical protein
MFAVHLAGLQLPTPCSPRMPCLVRGARHYFGLVTTTLSIVDISWGVLKILALDLGA